jgi:predicted DsbA family dithiol-disulfide isomerase
MSSIGTIGSRPTRIAAPNGPAGVPRGAAAALESVSPEGGEAEEGSESEGRVGKSGMRRAMQGCSADCTRPCAASHRLGDAGKRIGVPDHETSRFRRLAVGSAVMRVRAKGPRRRRDDTIARHNGFMEPQRLDIAFVSDVACPWCAIGLASLDRALARLDGEIATTVRVEPFELNPDMGPQGVETVPYLARKYGRTPEQIAQAQAMIRERGAAVGFTFGDRKHVWNTFNAHRMLHWAGLEGRALELKRALLRAYHGEGRDPGAADVLVDLAASVGLDPARAKAIAEGDEFAQEVRERERLWIERGVGGVPLVVMNGKYGIEGAQPPENYEQALRQIARSEGDR